MLGKDVFVVIISSLLHTPGGMILINHQLTRLLMSHVPNLRGSPFFKIQQVEHMKQAGAMKQAESDLISVDARKEWLV
jgi:hypothetical protein